MNQSGAHIDARSSRENVTENVSTDDTLHLEGDAELVDEGYESISSESSVSSEEPSEIYSSEDEKEYTTMSRFRRRRGSGNGPSNGEGATSTTASATDTQYKSRKQLAAQAKRSRMDSPDFVGVVFFLVVWSLAMVTIVQ
jgi:hypothetical protein